MAIVAILAFLLAGLAPGEPAAQVLRIDRKSQWETWAFPIGAVELHDGGGLQLKYFRRHIDPLSNASFFQHNTRQRGMVTGGVEVFSNRGDGSLLADGDHQTWWQPDPADKLDDWQVKVNLGRVVLLEKIRLVFPDAQDAKPFRDFSVYVSEGSTLSPTFDSYRFHRVGTTTLPNYDSVVEFSLSTQDFGDKATGEYLMTSQRLPYMPVHHLRFVPHQQTPNAALAELELVAVGDNIGPGTFGRGGAVRGGEKFVSQAPGLFDGTVDNYWNASAARAAEAHWRDGGQWFEWDLGSAFWLDQIVFYGWDPVELGRSTFLTTGGRWGYELYTSDGQRISLATEDRLMGNHNYQLLSKVDNTITPMRCIFDHRFLRRKVRHLFFNVLASDRYGFNWYEVFLFGQGYPAQVEITSDFIDLGSAKSFTGLSWEAELPPGTTIELRTRTGDQLAVEKLYYHRDGQRITEEQWERLPRVVRGPIEELLREGADWSGWSEAYVEPGEVFRSPTPRRYVRIKLILSTVDPEKTPLLHSLSLLYQEPLVSRGVAAEISPREAPAGVRQTFSYWIKPEYTAGDRGFDGVQMPIPWEVDEAVVLIGGREVGEATIAVMGDTLRVDLPAAVRRDSVEIRFTARLLANPTIFEAFLTHSGSPGSRQEVKPVHRDALKVFLPEVAGEDNLIVNLEIDPGLITPNDDGVNDLGQLKFDLLKVAVAPEVRIYDLSGRLIRKLDSRPGTRQRYTWDGRKDDGELAAPGTYIWRIVVKAEVGTQTTQRLIRVTY